MKETQPQTSRKIHSKSPVNTLIAWIILLIALTLTGVYTYNTKQRVVNETQDNFSFESKEIMANVNARLYTHAALLRTGASFIEACDTVTRKEWEIFYANQHTNKNLPGALGFGYAMIVSGNALKKHEQHIRKSGFPAYRIKPAGPRRIYTTIIYLEPFSVRNQEAFGYDMYSEPIRRIAMEKACDSNIASLSGKVTLVQEIDTDVQAGTLMYVPVYRSGMNLNTVKERRKAIKGWVYSPYRMNDFMMGILGNYETMLKSKIRMQIYDNDSVIPAALLFDSQTVNEYKHPDSKILKLKTPIVFNGKHWTLYFTKVIDLSSFYLHKDVLLVLMGGTLISFLISLLALFLFKNRYRLKLSTQLAFTLKANLDKQVALYNAIPDAIFVTDSKTGLIEEINRKASEQYGYSDDELKKMMSSELLVTPGSMDYTGNPDILNLGEQFHKKKNGTIFPVEVTSSPFELDQLKKVITIVRDITERKKAEEVLYASEQLYKTTLDASPDTIIVTDLKAHIIMASPLAIHLFGFKDIDQILGHNFKEFLAPEEETRAASILEIMLISDERRPLIFKCLHTEGNLIETEIKGEVFRNEKGAPNGYIFVIRDITERKRTQDLLLATLKEKEILLREVHHRVKNNLQVVSSLLNLQANKIDNQVIKNTLEESRNRIRSIALVHEKLYQTGNYAEINLKEYTHSLLTELFRAYMVDQEMIQIRTEIEDVNVPLIYAIPFGLILNEIISNSLKYAFPENHIFEPGPEIFITIKSLSDHQLQVCAGDNGIGLPVDIQLSDSTSLGLYLIRILSTEQLDGKIEIDTEKGTIFTITFNPHPT